MRVPRPRFVRAGVLVCDAEEIEAANPVSAWISETSERLALEQFLLLRKRQSRIGGDRCGGQAVARPVYRKQRKSPALQHRGRGTHL
jgi:hypothetical protein